MEQVGQVSEVTEQAPRIPRCTRDRLLRADGKPHSGILRLDSELIEKPDEIRVVCSLNTIKPVSIGCSGFSGHFDRIGVTACFGCRLRGYLMIPFEKMSACETRNANQRWRFSRMKKEGYLFAFSWTQAGTV